MSTGDQTAYVRSKVAERGTDNSATFSRDGFDNWAESTAPARAGQAEKVAAETQMPNRGGAMTVKEAKEVSAMRGGRSTAIVPFEGVGGRSFLGIEVPKIVEDAISYGEKLLDFAVLVDKKLPEIEQAMEEEIIYNNDDPSISAEDRRIAKAFLPLIQQLKGYFSTLKSIKKAADDIKSIVGAGMRGGATATETFNKIVGQLKKAYESVMVYVKWITKHGQFILRMLKLPPLQPIGKQILDKIQPILSLVGLGRGGAKCECNATERKGGVARYDATDGSMIRKGGADGMKMVNYAGPSEERMRSYRRELESQMEKVLAMPESPRKTKTLKYLKEQLAELESRGGALYSDPRLANYTPPTEAERQRMEEKHRNHPGSVKGGADGMQKVQQSYVNDQEEINRYRRDLESRMQEVLAMPESSRRTKYINYLKEQLAKLESRGGRRGGFAMAKRSSDSSYSEPLSTYDLLTSGLQSNQVMGEEEGARPSGVRSSGFGPSRPAGPPPRQMSMSAMDMDAMTPMDYGQAPMSSFTPIQSGGPFKADVGGRNCGGRRKATRKPSKRGEIVRKVMRERGLTLPQASKYVKENGLY
jgi:hypothetical protein